MRCRSLAQEVPPELAPYCRLRARAQLEPSDEALTEIFLLDHTAFPFLCVNAIQDQERRLRAVEAALGIPSPTADTEPAAPAYGARAAAPTSKPTFSDPPRACQLAVLALAGGALACLDAAAWADVEPLGAGGATGAAWRALTGGAHTLRLARCIALLWGVDALLRVVVGVRRAAHASWLLTVLAALAALAALAMSWLLAQPHGAKWLDGAMDAGHGAWRRLADGPTPAPVLHGSGRAAGGASSIAKMHAQHRRWL